MQNIEGLKMTYSELVREYFPDATDEEVELILWGKTGYPEFWNIGVDGDTPEECLRKQLQDFKNKVEGIKR